LSITQAGTSTFFFRHPRPVVDGRAVAVQAVQQKSRHAVSRTLLIVETPAPRMERPVTVESKFPG
jgi:hypothetical protein